MNCQEQLPFASHTQSPIRQLIGGIGGMPHRIEDCASVTGLEAFGTGQANKPTVANVQRIMSELHAD